MGVTISLVPFVSLNAQRATQVVRYSITGVSQGQISNGPEKTGTPAESGTTSGGFGSAPDAANAAAVPTPTAAGGVRQSSQTEARPASGVPMTTTPVWQASYQISNNEENKKLSVSIDSPMPKGTELTAEIGAPQGADATGPVGLETGAKDVVTAIGIGESGALPIQFSMSAPAGSAENAGNRKVTFTFISGS